MVDQDLLSKLKGLRGIMNAPSAAPNERENAKVLYNRLVTKYHVSESEFLEEEFELVQFHCANEYENKLAVQICCKVTNEKTIADYSYRKGFKEIVFKVTKTQAVEMRKQFELYRKDLTIESTKYDLHCTNPRHSFESRIDIREDEQKTVRFCVVCGKQLVPGLNPYKTPVCGGCGKEVAPVFWDYCLYCGMKLKE